MATAFRTPLSPAPRYAAPQRPRFNTNPSLGGLHSPPLRSGRGRSSVDNDAIPGRTIEDRLTGPSVNGIQMIGEGPDVQHPPALPGRPAKPTRPVPSIPDMQSDAAPMLVDPAPTPSPAISTNAITEFPLPPVRDSMALSRSAGAHSSASARTSSSGHTSTIEATPARPELVPAWEPDVKKHIPEEATLDSRIASYARLSEPPPKLRSQILARERGVTAELKEHDRMEMKGAAGERRGLQSFGSGSVLAESDEREKLGMLRQPAVNGLIRIEKSANLNSNRGGSTMVGNTSGKGKGKMRDQAIGMLSDLSGIAGEWALDPSLARLGSSANGHHAGRPSLDTNGSMAYSARTASSATGSRNSLFPGSSDQGHSLHSINSGSTLAMQDDPMNSSIWKKRKRFSQNVAHGGKNEPSAPAAVFETDKGNIDVRLSIVDDSARAQVVTYGGNTVMEQYMGSNTAGATAKKGLLNAKTQDIHAPPDAGIYGTEYALGETCAKVEILTRKGNVRVELPEIQRGRQAALQITSRDGNLFISLYVHRAPVSETRYLLPCETQSGELCGTHSMLNGAESIRSAFAKYQI
ncbi:hypothetical protein QFC21_001539 [Naganishia friedmannii]|uniref:Uncharacterized protein n=1 Tax=Naganishia friedmannii TaxID=89922 RepID=A0ACC2W4Q6_9TREE|nr:hypothetical protein QFC21_001539 [Naganishia friedmannii]